MSRKVLIGKKTVKRFNTRGKTVGTTAVQLSTDSSALEGGVQITADAGNSGTVYLGSRSNLTAGSSDETDGYPLAAGDSILLPVDSEATIYLVGSGAGQKVYYLSF
mgnify:CR=1 FL=1